MKKHKIILSVLLFFIYFLSLNATIKVGIYNDKPLIFDDENGNPCGIYPDILKNIAKKENWKINYVHGSLSELLALLKNNDIDLLVSVSPTPERKKYLKFSSETVFTNWATIVTRKKNHSISSFKDLNNKNIAIMKSDSYFNSFRKICKTLNISPKYIFYENYEEVTKSFLEGKSDAGILPRLYITMDSKYINSLRNTEIIFSPTKLKFATNINSHKHLLQTIDFYLNKMKHNPKSVYYKSINNWTGSNNITITQNFNKNYFVIFLLIILILFFYIFHIIHTEHKLKATTLNYPSASKYHDVYDLLPFTALEELSSTGLVVLDSGYRVKVANKSFSQIFNVDKEKIINQSLFNSINSDNIQKLKSILQQTANNENHFKNVQISINQQMKTLNITTLMIKNLENQLLQIFVLVEDLTELKKLTYEKNILLNDLQNSLSKSYRSILITDISGKIVFANKKFLKTFMFSNIETENKDIFSLIFADEYTAKNKVNSSTQNELTFESICKTKYSKTIQARITIYKRQHNHKFIGYYFFIEDITMEIKKKINYEKHMTHMDIVRNTLSDSIIFRKEINKDLTFLFVNSFDKRFLGYLLNNNAKKIEEIFNKQSERDRESLLEKSLTQIKHHKNKYLIKYKLADSTGKLIEIIEKGYAIKDSENRLKYLEGIIRINDSFEND